MTANTPRMTLVEVSGRSMLLSEAEIAAFERRFAEVLASTPAAPEEPPLDVPEPAEIPIFTGSDAAILAASVPAAAPVTTKGMPFWQNQRIMIAVGGLLLTLLIIAVSSLAEWSQGSGTRQLPLGIPTATATATTAATTVAATPTTAAHESTVVAYFDYANPESATEITTTGILRVDGQADSWRLVALSGGRQSVWIKLADVPKNVPVADPLPDLAPRPTAPPPARQPAAQSGGSSGGSSSGGSPARCETEADIRFTKEIVVTYQNPGERITHYPGTVTGVSCYSQAEADQRAEAGAAELIASDKAEVQPTMPPSATPMPLNPPTPTR